MTEPENVSTVVNAGAEQKYKKWILEQLEWLLDSSSNEPTVLVQMMSKGLLQTNEKEAIMAKTTTSEKWEAIYYKIRKLGLGRIDIVIDILQTTTNEHVANQFIDFREKAATDVTSNSSISKPNPSATATPTIEDAVFKPSALKIKEDRANGKVVGDIEQINQPRYGSGHLQGTFPLFLPEYEYIPSCPVAEKRVMDVQRFTDEQNMKSWWSTESNSKILLLCSGEDPAGAVSKLNKLSSTMTRFGIQTGIAQLRTGYRLGYEIRFKLFDKPQIEYPHEDVITVLNILSVALGQASHLETYFFSLCNSGVSFPIEETNALSTLLSRNNIDIFGSIIFGKTQLDIMNIVESAHPSKTNIIAGLDSSGSASEAVSKFKHLFDEDWRKHGIQWVFVNWEIPEHFEAPLFYLVKGKKILGACLDHFDTLLLAEFFRQPNLELRVLSLENAVFKTLQPARAKHIKQVYYLLTGNIFQGKIDPVDSNGNAANNEALINGLEILREYVEGNEGGVIKSLAARCARANSDVKTIIERHGWNNATKAFRNLTTTQRLIFELQHFIGTYSAIMQKLNQMLLLINGNDVTNITKQREEIIADTTVAEPIKEKLRYVNEDNMEELRVALAACLEMSTHQETTPLLCCYLARILEGEDSRTTVVGILKQIAEEDWPEKSKFLKSENDIMRLESPTHCLNSLCQYQNIGVVSMINHKLRRMPEFNCLESVQQFQYIFEEMEKENTAAELYAGVWKNPKIRFALETLVVQNDRLSEVIAATQCREGVPSWIPNRVATSLHKYIQSHTRQISSHLSEVNNIQKLHTMLEHYVHIDFIPPDFKNHLQQQLKNHPALEKEMTEILGNIPFWNSEHKCFLSAWSARTAENVMKQIEEHDSQQHQMGQPMQDIKLSVRKSKGMSNSTVTKHQISEGFERIVGCLVRKIDVEDLSKVREIADPMSSEDWTFEQVLHYVLQSVKMWGHSALQPEALDNIFRKDKGLAQPQTKPRGSRFSKHKSPNTTENEPTTPVLREVQNKKQKMPRISRLDILTCLLERSTFLVAMDLIRILSQFNIALPLILRSLEEDTAHTLIAPLISGNCTIKWEQNINRRSELVENRLFESPYRLVLAVRVGIHSTGKSTILNQLFKQPHAFSSCSEPGAESGVPFTLSGSAEFLWLTEETCSPMFWLKLEEFYRKTDEVLLLTNLHGECTEHLETLRVLDQFASSIVIFYMPDSEENHKAKYESIINVLKSESKISEIFVDPRYSVDDADIFNTSKITVACEIEKAQLKIASVLGMKPVRANLNTQLFPNSTNIGFPQVGLIEESKLLIEFISERGCEKVKNLLKLQGLQKNIPAASVWSNNHDLQHLIKLFCNMITLPIGDRQLAVQQFENNVSMLSGQASSQARKTVLAYKQQLNEIITKLDRNDLEVQQKRIRIKKKYKQIDRCSLGLEHFYRELGKIYIMSTTYLDNTQFFQTLPKVWGELLVSGHALEILNGDAGDIEGAWLSSILQQVSSMYPKLRVFVLSIVGLQSSGKSTLLNALFGCKFAVSFGRCTRGLYVRLLFLEKSLVEKSNCDAMLLIDSEGLGAPEKMNDPESEKMDRKMATFAMSVSNLTLINVLGEYVDALKNIFQIAIIAMARLEKARMSPDVMMVQHVAEGNEAKGQEGVDSFCQALEAAIEMTEKSETDMGIKNSKCVENLLRRAHSKDIITYFRGYKGGATANASPSIQYHEDVVKLYNKILISLRKPDATVDFKEWHKTLPDVWNALNREDFAVRFRDIKEISEFIRRGQGIAKVKMEIDTMFREHSKEIRLWTRDIFAKKDSNCLNKQVMFDAIAEKLSKFPSRCPVENRGCELCRAVEKSRGDFIKTISAKIDQKKTEKTLTDYENKIRAESVSVLKQSYAALTVKDGVRKDFDKQVDVEIRKIKTTICRAEESQRIAQNIWKELIDQKSRDIYIENINDRIEKEVSVSYRPYDGFLDALRNNYAKIDTLKPGMLHKIYSWFTNNPSKSEKAKAELFKSIEKLPEQLLQRYLADNYQPGMVQQLKKDVEFILQDSKFKVAPELKFECHVYAVSVFTAVMRQADKKWKDENNPLTILLASETEYKQYIVNRLRYGFTFASEGKIAGIKILEAISKISKESAEAYIVSKVLQHPWIVNSENVRLKYFKYIAEDILNGNKTFALQHFSNPNQTITNWFENQINDLSQKCSSAGQHYVKMFNSELQRCRDDVSKQSTCTDTVDAVCAYVRRADGLDYVCSENVGAANDTDLKLFKDNFLKSIAENEKHYKEIPIFDSAVSSKQITDRLGCTEHCPSCHAICWGEPGHEENVDNTKTHLTTHQIRGLSGFRYEETKNLTTDRCDTAADDTITYWGPADNRKKMTWRDMKLEEELRNWKFNKHCKTAFAELMVWFFLQLQEDIAASLNLKPALPCELANLTCNGSIDEILANIIAQIQ